MSNKRSESGSGRSESGSGRSESGSGRSGAKAPAKPPLVNGDTRAGEEGGQPAPVRPAQAGKGDFYVAAGRSISSGGGRGVIAPGAEVLLSDFGVGETADKQLQYMVERGYVIDNRRR